MKRTCKKRKIILKICQQCGKEYQARLDSKGKFCSHKCQGLSLNRSINCVCDQCGKKIVKTRAQFIRNKHNFCGKLCQYKFKSENYIGTNSSGWNGGLAKVNCSFCGKEIKKHRYEIERGDVKFCNKKCAGKHHGSIKGENHPCWKGGKIKVKCSFCGKTTEKFIYETNDRKVFFCGRKCFNEHQTYLHDEYIKTKLKCSGVKPENITPEMIELKREILQYKRIEKELKDVINSG